jgi:hypothetical protein
VILSSWIVLGLASKESVKSLDVQFHGTRYRTAVWTSTDSLSAAVGYVSSLSGNAPKGKYVRISGQAGVYAPQEDVNEQKHKSGISAEVFTSARRIRQKTAPKEVRRNIQFVLLESSNFPNQIGVFKFETKAVHKWVIPNPPLTIKAGDLTFVSRRPRSSIQGKWIIEFEIRNDDLKKLSDIEFTGVFFGKSPSGPADRSIAVIVKDDDVSNGRIAGRFNVMVGKPLDSLSKSVTFLPTFLKRSPVEPKHLDFEFDWEGISTPEEKVLLPK